MSPPRTAPPKAAPPKAPKAAPSKAPKAEPKEDSGLGVAQIVITAATPMIEEPEQPFPPPEPEADIEEGKDEADEEDSSLSEQTAVCVRAEAPPASSSTASEGESVASGPPTAPQSPPAAPQSPPAAPRAGRASIPDELEPAQLARLTDLKESNA